MVIVKLRKLLTIPVFGHLAPGTEIGMPDDVAAHMIVSGYAVSTQEPKEPEPPKERKRVEPASAPEKESEE